MNCPACGVANPQVFYDVRNVPTTSNLLMKSREEALNWPRGDIRLAHCSACDFITNVDFYESSLPRGEYEASQACSPTFGRFAEDLANDWVGTYDLRGRRVLEIGSGDGAFLKLMCRLTGHEGLGVDPLARVEDSTDKVSFIAEKFLPEHLQWEPELIYCRHTLEHIPDVREFLSAIAPALRAAKSQAVVAIEVPDTLRVLREAAFWDIYYEHCSYFTEVSLRFGMEQAGLQTLRRAMYYDDQYLVVEGQAGHLWTALQLPHLPSPELSSLGQTFAQRVDQSLRQWRSIVGSSRSCVLWGAGSKAVGFLTTLGVGDEVKAVIDINPAKQNSFLPGTGHEIVAPDRLREIRPDRVIVMNPVYAKEIEASLNAMGLRPEISLLS